jgi:glyceraldehyde-3-phosphate dehydrogenase/erythrose-4-phosphate dehydrogenase
VRKVIVAAPVKAGALNVVMGVNDHLYRPAERTTCSPPRRAPPTASRRW